MEEFRRSVSTGGEYTFNCDDPMACITAFDETMTVDEQPESSKL